MLVEGYWSGAGEGMVLPPTGRAVILLVPSLV